MTSRCYIGVDFGTSRSGFASCLDGSAPREHNKYPGQLASNAKTLTALLYKSTGPVTWELVSWGWEAFFTYKSFDLAQQQQHALVDRFKLALAPAGERGANRALPAGLSGERLVTDYLRKLGEYARKQVAVQWQGAYTPGNTTWALTVPANWSDAAKATMRRAAFAAGLIPSESSTQLVLAHEPEAGALAVMNDKSLAPSPGSTIMVIDAGGGTVDITVHRVGQRQQGSGSATLEEVVPRKGIMAGSTFINDAFESWARNELGTAQWDAWRGSRCRDHAIFLLRDWESGKVVFGPRRSNDGTHDNSTTRLTLPASLLRALPEHVVSTKLHDEMELEISYSTMASFFDPLVNRTLTAAREALQAAGGRVDHIFVIGGFGESPYLLHKLREGLQTGSRNGIMAADFGSSAVVKGATKYAQLPAVIAVRCAAFSYGIRVRDAWVEGMPEELKVLDADSKSWKCSNCFNAFVTRGDKLTVGHTVTKITTPATRSAQNVVFPVFVTDKIGVNYTTLPGMKQLGELTLALPDGWADTVKSKTDYDLATTMCFGSAELVITAIDKQTGKQVNTTMEFAAL